jgi:hypothetical protein
MRHDSIGEPPLDPPERPDDDCPDCGEGHVHTDDYEQSYTCDNPDCDYGGGTDWDAVAEARAEAREDW